MWPTTGRSCSSTRPANAGRRAMRNHDTDLSGLGDFTATPRMVLISVMAVGVGFICAFVALALLKLIAFFTNLFFFQRLSTALSSPADNTLGYFVVLVPIAGALIIGVMARYGSE